MSIHDGHRERLKAQFREGGLDGMTDERALELLLFYAIPMSDVYPLSKSLIARFGSLTNVLSASIEELCEVPGVGANTATLIKLVPQMTKKYLVSTAVSIEKIETRAQAGVYLMPFFFGARDELAYALFIDSEGYPLDLKRIAKGEEHKVDIVAEDVVRIASELGAARVVLAHNHTSNVALSSASDVLTTRTVREALAERGIELWDHVIITKNDFVSMRDSDLI